MKEKAKRSNRSTRSNRVAREEGYEDKKKNRPRFIIYIFNPYKLINYKENIALHTLLFSTLF